MNMNKAEGENSGWYKLRYKDGREYLWNWAQV